MPGLSAHGALCCGQGTGLPLFLPELQVHASMSRATVALSFMEEGSEHWCCRLVSHRVCLSLTVRCRLYPPGIA